MAAKEKRIGQFSDMEDEEIGNVLYWKSNKHYKKALLNSFHLIGATDGFLQQTEKLASPRAA